MSFGTRLAEERKRLGLKQAGFGALVGVAVPRQSLYENDKRELRAPYLARIGAVGVDVVYVPTGLRGKDGSLSQESNDLLNAHLALPDDMRKALEDLARALHQRFPRRPSR